MAGQIYKMQESFLALQYLELYIVCNFMYFPLSTSNSVPLHIPSVSVPKKHSSGLEKISLPLGATEFP